MPSACNAPNRTFPHRGAAAILFAALCLLAASAIAPREASAACRTSGEGCSAFNKCCSGLSCGPLWDLRCYHSPREQGEPCSADNKCASGLCCGWDSKCKAAGTSGEPCADCPDNACAGDTSCGPTTESPRRCYNTPRELGEPCSTSGCASGLSCGPVTNPVCFHNPRQEGEPCSSTACGDGLCCNDALVCEAAGAIGEPCGCPLRLNDGGCEEGSSCGPITESPPICYGNPRQLGEPCSSTACAPGLSCGPIDDRTCYHFPRQEGEPCSSTPCGEGLCCDTNFRCRVSGGLGDECTCPWNLSNSGCQEGLTCGPLYESPRRCYSEPRALGEPCSAFNPCGDGLSCGPIGDAVCYHAPRELDEPCSAFEPCGTGLYCDQRLRCAERAGPGEACNPFDQCVEGYSCGPLGDQVCYPDPREYGQPCSAVNACGSGLSCQPGVQKCYTVPRQYEEPCSLGFECDEGLTCQPGVQKCYNEVREAGEPCSLGFPCGDGLSCQPGVQKCYHVPRQYEEPCSLGFECGEGLSCQPGVQKCYHVPRRYDEPCSAGFECGDCLSCHPGIQRCYNHPRTAGEPCSAGFPCGQTGFECNAALFRCTPPDAFQVENAEVCRALYSAELADLAIEANVAMGYSIGGSATAGIAASVEIGVVYGESGEFGCFTGDCLGAESDVGVATFFSATQVTSWADFPGESLVTSFGFDVPSDIFGFSIAAIYSTDFSTFYGTAEAISVGIGFSPIDVGEAWCETTVYEIPSYDIPTPEPNCDCEDIAAPDSDGDGFNDCVDGCPDDPAMSGATPCRDCGEPAADADGDGTEDCVDACPDDPLKIEGGDCGCGVAETDTDQDGTPDCVDECPTASERTVAGDCGCTPSASDRDGDGVIDCEDGCPDDRWKSEPGVCGCGLPDLDVDGDDEVDPCGDLCPDDDTKTVPGLCGCGQDEPSGSHDPDLTCVDGQAECAGALTPVATGATAIDKCGVDLTPTTTDSGTFPLGSATVTWSATDVDGNTASCDATATVVDTTAPLLLCRSGVAECGGARTAVTLVGLAWDVCEGPVAAVPDDPGPYPPGRTPVTFAATDGAGNTRTCAADALVIDTTAPSVACAGDTQECSGALTPVTTACTATDTCDANVQVGSTAAPSYPLGTYGFRCAARDHSGNGATVTCAVRIVDTAPPTASCTGDTQECAGPLTPVTTTCTGSDACDVEVEWQSTAADAYPLGRSLFACAAYDDAGNVDTTTCDVSVVDTTAPDVTCAGETVECSAPPGSGEATVTGSASDVCWDTVAVAGTGTARYAVGSHEVTVTGRDPSGNVGTCVATVVVEDTTAPTVVATPGDDVYACGEPYVEHGATAADVCDGDLTEAIVVDAAAVDTATPTSSQSAPTDVPYVVTYAAADGAGNEAGASRSVTVLRYFAPDEGLLWRRPIGQGTGGADDTDPSGVTTADPADDRRIPLHRNRAIPVRVRVVDAAGVDVTADPAVGATVSASVVESCHPTVTNGVVEEAQDVIDRAGGPMTLVVEEEGEAYLQYDLSTAGWPESASGCYVLTVTAHVAGFCNDTHTEHVVLEEARH